MEHRKTLNKQIQTNKHKEKKERKEKEKYLMLKMKTPKNLNKGFTLVELIVVIAIIAVLSVVAVVAYSNISKQAEDAAVRSDANTVIRALNTYNALTNKALKTDRDKLDAGELQGLALDTSSVGFDMQLGVSITDERLGKVKGVIEYDTDSKMWILTTDSTDPDES